MSKYTKRDPVRKAEHDKRYYEANREKRKAYITAWRAERPDKRSEYRRKTYENNKARHFADAAERRARKRNACPSWSQRAAIEALYDLALRMRAAGEDVHVDHVYPLRGKLVCGLHVIENLRIAGATENCSKAGGMPSDALLAAMDFA